MSRNLKTSLRLSETHDTCILRCTESRGVKPATVRLNIILDWLREIKRADGRLLVRHVLYQELLSLNQLKLTTCLSHWLALTVVRSYMRFQWPQNQSKVC